MFITKTAQKITPAGAKKSRFVHPGDFLLSNSMSFGRPYILKIGGCIHDGWLVLHDNHDLFDKRFLYFCLSSPSIYHKFKSMAVGGVVNNLNSAMVRTVEIPVPDKQEQKKVANTLGTIDKILRHRRAQLAALDALVKSRFVEMFGDPVSNSKHLPVRPLSELGSLERGRSKHRPRNDPKLLNGPYPLIQTGEVASADVYVTTYQHTYSELGLRQSKLWEAGTLCITIAANIAQTAILTFDACFPDSVVGFVPNDKVDALYMHYWFGFFQKILEEQAPQVAQKNINLKILSELQVVLPDTQQRKQFTSFVSNVERAKTAIRQFLAETQTLFDSLMQEYFA